MLTIEIQNRTLSDPQLNTVTLDLLQDRMTVAAFIQRTIEERLRAEDAHRTLTQLNPETTAHLHAADPQHTQPQLNPEIIKRHYLTPEEITAQARHGSVHFPTPPASTSSSTIQTQVEKAWRAFTSCHFLLFVDNRRLHTLDETITFLPTTKITFLRLTPLVGG